MKLICSRENCNREFTPKNRKQRFCCTICTYIGKCELCKKDYTKKHSKQRFCEQNCATIFSVNLKETDERYEEFRNKRNKKLSDLSKNNKNKKEWSEKIGKASNRRKRTELPANIMGCSSRTRSKILKRLEVKCCVCNWAEGSCDLHHIKGKKIVDCHNHTNLTVLCPNHHRLFHEGKILEKDIKTFEDVYGNRWLEVYYM